MALLVFPEGTDLSPQNVVKDAEYADKKKLRRYRYLLHPRTAGFAAAVRAFGTQLDAVYDVTVSYDNHPAIAASADPRPSESAPLYGLWPRAAHFHVERVPPEALLLRRTAGAAAENAADADEGASGWLIQSWEAKEDRLASGMPTTATAATPESALGRVGVRYTLALATWCVALTALVWAASQSSPHDASSATATADSWAAWAWAVRAHAVLGTFGLALITSAGGLDALELWWHPAPPVASS